jgi:hypothetical protein
MRLTAETLMAALIADVHFVPDPSRDCCPFGFGGERAAP